MATPSIIRTIFGRLAAGTIFSGSTENIGDCICYKSVTVAVTTTGSGTINLPNNSKILEVVVFGNTQYDSATSATLTVGQAAAGTDYVTSVDVKAGTGKMTVTYTDAQRVTMQNIGTNTSVVATVTIVGATTVGSVEVGVNYIPGFN